MLVSLEHDAPERLEIRIRGEQAHSAHRPIPSPFPSAGANDCTQSESGA